MSNRVYITGMGVVSSIGMNVEENLQSLKTSKTGLCFTQFLDSIHKHELPVCEIPLGDDALAERLGLSVSDGYTRTSLLGLLAVKEALASAGISDMKSATTALISSTTVGGMRNTEMIYHELLSPNLREEYINFLNSHDLGESTERIADYFGVKDFVTTISTACSSSANAIILGARLIKHGIVDRAICGGTDTLSKFTINGFNSLMILDKEHSRPFDDSRVGLNLGEGAGYIILESEALVKKENKKIFAELTGYSNTNDAFHQTASSPEGNGAFMAMSEALEMSGLSKSDISYINVHGTATPNNDVSEGRAMHRLFGDALPKFSSTKPFTGHTLAACGGIEAVYAILAIQHSLIFPSLNFKNKMNEVDIAPQTTLLENYEVNHVLSNSFGFGGNNTSIIISKA